MPEAYASILRTELGTAGLKCTDIAREKLLRYCQELDHWKVRVNLTSLSGAELVKRLVIEPVWIGRRLGMSGTLVDIGSGNGSPAIPLSLTEDFSEIHLVEARSRRSAFLRHLIRTLQIHAEVHHNRFAEAVEEMPPADWITLQAIHPTEELIGSMREISKPTTTAVWITSSARAVSLGTTLKTPFRETEAVLFNPLGF